VRDLVWCRPKGSIFVTSAHIRLASLVLALGWTLLARDEWFKRLHARLDLSHLRRPSPSGNSAPPLPPELLDRWVKLQHRSKRAASATRAGFRISE
jgi:hypothetical protein